MFATSPGERFQAFPLRSHLTSFDHEERAVIELSAVLEAPVERAPVANLADCLLLCSGGVEKEAVRLLQAGAARVILAGEAHNAHAAGAEVVAWARDLGLPVHLQLVSPATGPTLRCWLQAQRALVRLREARLGVLGGSADWLVASLPDPATLTQRFGVSLAAVSWPELAEAIGDDFPFRKAVEAERWTSLPRDAEVSSADMRRALGFTAALGAFARQRGLQAVTLNCFEAIQRLGVTGCLALADLDENGVPSACEGDIVTALTKLIIHEATGCVSWMANLVSASGTTVRLAHCTAPPSLSRSSRLRRHLETGQGVAFAGRFPADQPVTLLRLSRDLKEAVLLRGRTVDEEPSASRCRTQVRVELDHPLPAVLGNHHALVFGDQWLPLFALLGLAGVRVLGCQAEPLVWPEPCDELLV
ncbi:MAG: hypothetical protein RBU45_06985 [Myxococcota bacterium]|jgi:L-fucose isomerase-like protein|nr:hypothetical protein [Myxococcota bacterium]